MRDVVSNRALVASSVRTIACLALGATMLGCTTTPEERWASQCAEDLGMSEAECQLAYGFRLPDALPPSRGNRYADDEAAARLGHRIFFDTGFSTTDSSCSSCHRPENAFAEPQMVSEVIAGMPGTRNSPSLLVAARNDGFWLWDGAADSLWSQPLFALENPIEMASSRLELAHRIDSEEYRSDYEAVFGTLTNLSNPSLFPRAGGPGDVSWDGMTEANQDVVNRVAANVGKALEAYLRRIASGPSRMDRYIDGDRTALSADERVGFTRFVRTCSACHFGPMLTDDAFHVASMEMTDRGRALGVVTLLESPFNALGPYFDPATETGGREPLPLPLGPTTEDERSFRTPTLRNVTLTAPYTHSGRRSLNEILATPSFFYEEGDEVVIAQFLEALIGEPAPSMWTQPPP
jgi:cytochrome c peroxidase